MKYSGEGLIFLTKKSRIPNKINMDTNAIGNTIARADKMMLLASESVHFFSEANLLTMDPIPKVPILANCAIAKIIDHNPKNSCPITRIAKGVSIKNAMELSIKKEKLYEIAFTYLFK